jgi:RND family efflux transporter MFP subunit
VISFETQFANIRQKLLTLGLSPRQIDTVVKTRRVIDALPVRAPMDGVVVDFDRVLGQVIRADEPLFEIHDLSQAWVQAFVGERDSAHVQVDQTARIHLVAHPDFVAEGTVVRIGPVVGADSRTQAAWIEFQKPPSVALQHNMLARVTLTMDRPPPTLAVPLNTVVRDGLRSFVFVRKSDGTFDRRRVEVGRADDRFLEITSGLTRGESVATSGVTQIQTAYSALR